MQPDTAIIVVPLPARNPAHVDATQRKKQRTSIHNNYHYYTYNKLNALCCLIRLVSLLRSMLHRSWSGSVARHTNVGS